MKKFIQYIAVFVTPFLLGTFILFLFPIDKNFSYHFVKGECDDKASWIYNRIFTQAENIDIAFSGASQTSCAIMDETIEKLLSANGKELKVANLGYCRRGRDIQYVMLKDLFNHKKPKILIIEVAEDEPKKSHPVFPYLAESNDLRGSFVLFNQRYFINIRKGIVVRFEQLKYHIFKNENYSNENHNRFGYIPSSQIVQPELIRQNAENWEMRLSKTTPEILRSVETNYSKHYIEKIAKLAADNNCQVLFLYLPESGSKMRLPMLIDFYQKFGNLYILPDSIVNNKNNWKDATHFNDSGAQKVSEFIADELIDILN